MVYKNFLYDRVFEKLEVEQREIGYYSLPFDKDGLIAKIESFKVLDSISDVVVIGIGGSSLGAKAIDRALRYKNPNARKLHFLENSDPINLLDSLKNLKRETTVFILISKSGATIETTSIYKLILEKFALDINDRFTKERLIVITDNDSPLSKYAKKYSLKEFNIPLNVGGRFSVLSAVGLVPLYLCGYDIKALLNGAKEFLESFFKREKLELIDRAMFLAQNSTQYPINVIFSYSSLLEYLGAWYVQLWGESLGKIDKSGKSVGLTPISLVGSTDQHSFLQLIIEGVKDKTVTFIKVKDFGVDLKVPNISIENLEKVDYINSHQFQTLINAQCDATLKSVMDSNVPVDLIELEKLDEKNLGELIIYFELLTSLVGILFDVNTYDQPGVELGKKILVEKFKKA